MERGQILGSLGPYLIPEHESARLTLSAKSSHPSGTRALEHKSIRGKIAQDGLYVPIRASWYPQFMSELLSFPAGRWDDVVDALSCFGQMLGAPVLRGVKKREEVRPLGTEHGQILGHTAHGSDRRLCNGRQQWLAQAGAKHGSTDSWKANKTASEIGQPLEQRDAPERPGTKQLRR